MDRRRRAARTVALMSLFTMTDTQTDVSIASFDGDGSELVSLIVGIDPVQAGSGDPSPTNIRPISGWTGAKVTRTGKNLFSYNNITRKQIYRSTLRPMGDDLNSFYLCGATGSNDEAMLDVASWAYVTAFIGFRVKEDTPITVSCKVKNYTADCNGFVRVRYNTTENRDGSTVVNTVFFNTVGTSNISISGTIPSGNYVFFEFSPAAKGESVTLTQYAEVTDFQFEVGSTATAYEPYQAETYSITFPSSAGTVYGGTLDVTTGKLTVDRAMVDLGAETWTRQATGNTYRFVLSGYHTLPGAKTTGGYDSATLCSMYPSNKAPISNNNVDDCYAVYNGVVLVRDDSYNTADAFKTAMSGVQLCYELSTPIVYDLTPTEINTLLGANNIWADTGDIKYIEYNI